MASSTATLWGLLPGIDYRKVLAIDLYLFRKSTRIRKLLKLLTSIKQLCLKRSYVKPGSRNVFIQSLRRKDYDEMFLKICNAFDKDKSIVILGSDYTRFDLWFFFYLVLSIRKIDKHQFEKWDEYIYSVITFASYIRYIKCIDADMNMLVVFSDMQAVDNLLVQVAKTRGIKTVTLQHGLYVDYASLDNVNKFNYLNSEAEYFLAWGEDTKNLIEKYKSSNVLICGKPSKMPDIEKSDPEYFTVIFDQNIFHENNKEMMSIAHKIASNLGIKSNIRLHPHNKLKWYRYDKNLCVIGMPIENSSFVIGHTSSLMYECLRIGIPTFRYKTDVPSNNCPNEITFTDCDEFFDKYRNSQDLCFSNIGKTYIETYGNNSIEKYSTELALITQS